MITQTRCAWCGEDPLYVDYHDREWGVPLYDDGKLFEFMILEGAQAGLSWLTILKKREQYRRVFDHFDAHKIAAYSKTKIDSLMTDTGIVRNRLKIEAAVKNARAVLKIKETHGSLQAFLWRYVQGRPIQNKWRTVSDLPAETALSTAMSKDLKKMGCAFVGPTICYAFMQAVGMVNDHTRDCFRHQQVAALAQRK